MSAHDETSFSVHLMHRCWHRQNNQSRIRVKSQVVNSQYGNSCGYLAAKGIGDYFRFKVGSPLVDVHLSHALTVLVLLAGGK